MFTKVTTTLISGNQRRTSNDFSRLLRFCFCVFVLPSEVKQLLSSLLWDIYGKQRREQHSRRFSKYSSKFSKDDPDMFDFSSLKFASCAKDLEHFSARKLIDISAILKVEIRLMGHFLERVLISRERNRRHQDTLCGFVDALLYVRYREYIFHKVQLPYLVELKVEIKKKNIYKYKIFRPKPLP